MNAVCPYGLGKLGIVADQKDEVAAAGGFG